NVSWGREYALAMYFLLQHPRDSLGNSSTSLPNAWWSGNDVDVGRPLSGHYPWNGVWRKDFSGGLVLVNEPDAPTRPPPRGGPYRRPDGTLANQVTLGPADGVVLRRCPPSPRARMAASSRARRCWRRHRWDIRH